jgi:hypothetical protein
MPLIWNATKEEHEIMGKIADRFVAEFQGINTGSKLDIMMDLEAIHCNGNPLKLQELLEAKKFDFNHDMIGIIDHINRKTGKLQDCFVPRYSMPN